MVKEHKSTHKEFMENNFVICPFCSYNNKVEKFIRFGTYLRCLQVIDDKIYFRTKLGIEIRKIRYKEKSL